MTARLILRAIRRWYDPEQARQREERTERARVRAIAIRVHSESVDRRVAATRRSYEMASRRLNHNGGAHDAR